MTDPKIIKAISEGKDLGNGIYQVELGAISFEEITNSPKLAATMQDGNGEFYKLFEYIGKDFVVFDEDGSLNDPIGSILLNARIEALCSNMRTWAKISKTKADKARKTLLKAL